MLIKGFNKLTLLDYPGYIACVIFTLGCNWKCPFCQNSALVIKPSKKDLISEDEIINYMIERKGKIDGICISGGEPTIQPDLKPFIKRIKDLGFLVKLDTNGTNPDVLSDLLKDNLLDYIAMDIKNIKDKYESTVDTHINYDNILKSINIIKNSNIDHEFRTTVVNEYHTKDDLVNIAKLVSPSNYYLQQFKDAGDLIGDGLTSHTSSCVLDACEACNEYTKTETRGI